MNRSREECYCCSSMASSREHVPPQCFFPENKDLPPGLNLRKNLITVPSCDLHNLKKSKDDEYLLHAIVTNMGSNPVGLHHFLTKLMRSIQRDPTLVKRIFSRSESVRLKDPDSGAVTTTALVQIEEKRVNSAFDLMLRALYYHHFGKKWTDDIWVCPEFLLAIRGEDAQKRNADVQQVILAADTIFSGIPRIGQNPEVFQYHFAGGNDHYQKIVRLYFYGGTSITATFSPHA